MLPTSPRARVALGAAVAALTLGAPAAARAADDLVRCSDTGTALALAGDGGVLVGGSTYTNEVVEEPGGGHGHVGDFSVLRLTARGALDRAFGENGHADVDVGDFDDLADLARDGRGRVVGAGSTRNVVDGGLGPYDIAVWRHAADGALDPSFGDDGTALLDLGDSERVRAIAVDRRGRVLVAGHSDHGDHTHALLLRLTADGALDEDFGQGGQAVLHDLDAVTGVHVDRTGRITLAGTTTKDGAVATAVLRLGDDGAPRTGFGEDGRALVAWPGLQAAGSGALALDRSGRILTATAATDGTSGVIGTARLTRAGTLDASWGDGGRAVVDLPTATDAVGALAATRAGDLLLAGAGYPADAASGDGFLAKLTRHGAPATGFATEGVLRASFGLEYSALNDLVVHADGRITAAGWNFSEDPDRLPASDVAVVRVHPDGGRDRTWGAGGTVLADIQGAPVCERFAHDER